MLNGKILETGYIVALPVECQADGHTRRHDDRRSTIIVATAEKRWTIQIWTIGHRESEYEHTG